MIKVRNLELFWLLATIYASPRISERSILWNNLTNVAEAQSLLWIMMGDFNELLMSDDKFGGRPINFRYAMKFQNFLNTCGMMDMGFSENRFTWTNSRGMANLTRLHSDHSPLLIYLDSKSSLHLSRPFRF